MKPEEIIILKLLNNKLNRRIIDSDAYKIIHLTLEQVVLESVVYNSEEPHTYYYQIIQIESI